MLASLLKGPNFYNPDRHPDRSKDRLAYVLDRMQEDGVITAGAEEPGAGDAAEACRLVHPHRDTGFHFVDFLGREAKADGVQILTADSYTVHSTINAQLQRDAEAALAGRLGALRDCLRARAVSRPGSQHRRRRKEARTDNHSGTPAWQQALIATRLPLYDVHWTPAVVVQKGAARNDSDTIRVGLADGRVMVLDHGDAGDPAQSRPL